jgi:hypothetical protein
LAEKFECAATNFIPALGFLSHLLRDPAGVHAVAGSDSGRFSEDNGSLIGAMLRATTFAQL